MPFSANCVTYIVSVSMGGSRPMLDSVGYQPSGEGSSGDAVELPARTPFQTSWLELLVKTTASSLPKGSHNSCGIWHWATYTMADQPIINLPYSDLSCLPTPSGDVRTRV